MDKLSEILKKVKEVLPPQAQVAISGGAVRDTLLGIPYKDVDVIILPSGLEDQLEETVDEVLKYYPNADLCGFRETYEDPNGEMEGGSDFDARLYGVVKIVVEGEEVDLLFQKDMDTFEEVVQGYDHVANMVYLTEEGLKLGTNLPFVRAMLKANSGFNLIRDLRSCRRAKMQRIMAEYSSEVEQYLERVGAKYVV